MVGRTDGEAGNRTSYSPVGAGTGAELGKLAIMATSQSLLEKIPILGFYRQKLKL